MQTKSMATILWIALCAPAVAQQPASDKPAPTAQAILDAVGGPFTDVFAKFGTPEKGLVADVGATWPVVIDYIAFAFRVHKKKVVSAEFRIRWAGDTFRDVRLGDTTEQVTKKLGKADKVTRAAGTERHTWVDEINHHDLRIIFDAEHKCTRVSLVAADSAP